MLRKGERKNLNRKYTIIALLTMTMLLFNISLSNIPSVSAVEMPLRDEILWGNGYWPEPTSFCPAIMDWGQGWDTYIMYEAMFGVDAASGHLIKWLGESIEWIDDYTIKVTLRKKVLPDGKIAPYWVKITDWTAWQAGTGGVEYYRQITAEDVKYSFYLYGGFDESPDGMYWHMDGFKERVGSDVNFEIVDDRTFKVRVKAAYPRSPVVYETLTSCFLIMPKDIWQQIEAAYPGWIPDFPNDWTNNTGATPPEWRVASGMYLPWFIYTGSIPFYTIMKKNPLWWGIDVLGRQPAPEYLGYRLYETNDQIVEATKAGLIDWDGDYLTGITTYPEWNTYLYTYLPSSPYFIDVLTKILVPNHRKWPLGEQWLHHAITHVFDVSRFNELSSYYLYTEPSPLYIPNDDYAARTLLNLTIEDHFKDVYFDGTYEPDVAEALSIIQANCVDKNGGTWEKGEEAYTKDGPSMAWVAKYLVDDVDLTVGTVTHPASYWDTNGFGEADQLAGVAGINVKLGPWELIDVVGWTDINAISAEIAYEVTNDLSISLTFTPIDYGAYETAMDYTGAPFDFSHECMTAGVNNDMYARYFQFFVGAVNAYNHFGDYRNSEIEALLVQLEIPPPGKTRQEIANEIQEIVGSELPFIPTAGHPDWYIYYTKYWTRWPNSLHAFTPCSPYGGSGQAANLQYIILSLGSAKCPSDINNDRKVNIADVFVMAKAFGSYPGHIRWEFVADINGDGKVDIKDIYIAARNFGKTY